MFTYYAQMGKPEKLETGQRHHWAELPNNLQTIIPLRLMAMIPTMENDKPFQGV
jgi:hypothetical protein